MSAAGSAIIEKTLGRKGPHSRTSFTDQLETNLVGSFMLLTLAAEAMAGNEPEADGSRGVIALTSSVAAYEGQMGQVAYAASKGGVNAMVLPAARDFGASRNPCTRRGPGRLRHPIHGCSQRRGQGRHWCLGAIPAAPRARRRVRPYGAFSGHPTPCSMARSSVSTAHYAWACV